MVLLHKYPDLQNVLRGIVRQAGALIVAANSDNDRQQTQKSNIKDFVTVADIRAQNIIEKQLKAEFPNEMVLSEEHAEQDRKKLFNPGFTGFVVDPIDGTYNFKRDMRESAVSVGYIVNGQCQTGVIYDPYKNELFAATKGMGATRNGQPIRVSAQKGLHGASIATSNSYDDAAMARNLRRHLVIYEQTGVMPWTNCPGSGVLIMAYIACGRFDIYHHNGLKPWDNAAAFLLVREAGGKVRGLKGEDINFTSNTVLMGVPALVDELVGVFTKVNPDLLW